ncbi:MAG: sulfite exporter TauE/SafE family protein [Nitrososphaerales archaeon]
MKIVLLHEILILLIASFGAGTLGSLLGLGGGFIIVPTLTFMSLNPSQIASTSLFAVFSTSASSTLAYARQKRIDYVLGIKFAAFTMPGAILGAYISSFLSMPEFKFYFVLILVGTAIYILRKNTLKERSRLHLKGIMALCYASSFFAGVLASLFGIGGGVIFVPIMVALLRMSMHKSAPTSQFILLISSIVGLFTHVALGHPDYFIAAIIVAGAFGGAQLGSMLLLTIKEKILQTLLSIGLLAVAVKLLGDEFFFMLNR